MDEGGPCGCPALGYPRFCLSLRCWNIPKTPVGTDDPRRFTSHTAMAKKKAAVQEEPRPGVVPNRDIVQRLNFLHQAANLACVAVPPPRPPSSAPGGGKRALRDPGNPVAAEPPPKGPSATRGKTHEGSYRRDRRRRFGKRLTRSRLGLELSQELGQTMRSVAKKAALRMSPSVKRSLCKQCGATLAPGVTASFRLKPARSHAHMLAITCFICKHRRRIPQNPELPGVETAVPHSLSSQTPLPLPHPPPPVDETMQGTSTSIADPPLAENGSTAAPRPTKPCRKKREAKETKVKTAKTEQRRFRQRRQRPFWERDEHVVFAGDQRIN